MSRLGRSRGKEYRVSRLERSRGKEYRVSWLGRSMEKEYRVNRLGRGTGESGLGKPCLHLLYEICLTKQDQTVPFSTWRLGALVRGPTAKTPDS